MGGALSKPPLPNGLEKKAVHGWMDGCEHASTRISSSPAFLVSKLHYTAWTEIFFEAHDFLMSFSFFPSRSLLLLLATIRRPKTTAVSNRMSGRAQRALDLIAAADEASVGCPLSPLHPASTLRDQETSLERNAVPILCPI